MTEDNLEDVKLSNDYVEICKVAKKNFNGTHSNT